jgi:hypothetical protein
MRDAQNDRSRDRRAKYGDAYKHADAGYISQYGDKNQYKQRFQQGYVQGYQQGFYNNGYYGNNGQYGYPGQNNGTWRRP